MILTVLSPRPHPSTKRSHPLSVSQQTVTSAPDKFYGPYSPSRLIYDMTNQSQRICLYCLLIIMVHQCKIKQVVFFQELQILYILMNNYTFTSFTARWSSCLIDHNGSCKMGCFCGNRGTISDHLAAHNLKHLGDKLLAHFTFTHFVSHSFGQDMNLSIFYSGSKNRGESK